MIDGIEHGSGPPVCGANGWKQRAHLLAFISVMVIVDLRASTDFTKDVLRQLNMVGLAQCHFDQRKHTVASHVFCEGYIQKNRLRKQDIIKSK